MRVIAVIQARLGSTRLPRKILADIWGQPMLRRVVDRAKAIPGVDQVVLAIAEPEPDAELMAFVWPAMNTPVYSNGETGKENDVLYRVVEATKFAERNFGGARVDVIARLTADCPLLAPEVCAEVIDRVVTDGAEYATNDTTQSGYPDGLDCQAFTRAALDAAHERATDPYDREHVCPWMERHLPLVAVCRSRDATVEWPKLSVDTQDDLNRVRRIMASIPAGDYSWKATQEAIRALGL